MKQTLARICTTVFMLGTFLVVGAVEAQERTASGAINTQETWSSVTNGLNAIKTKSDMIDVRIDQAVICGRKKMLYAPGAAEADPQGCVFATLDPSTTNTINNMTLCALKGAVYSSSTNSCVYPGKERWFFEGSVTGYTVRCGSLSGQCSSSQLAPPAGYAACSGTQGTVARLCTGSGQKCFVTIRGTVNVPRTCSSRGGDSSDRCTGGGSYNTYVYDKYLCE